LYSGSTAQCCKVERAKVQVWQWRDVADSFRFPVCKEVVCESPIDEEP